MILMSGKELAATIHTALAGEISLLTKKPKLVVIQVGDNEASSKYIRMKQRACEEVSIAFEHIQVDSEIPDEQLQAYIDELNLDPTVTGIIVQLPLPEKISSDFILESIDPGKDVDGLTSYQQDMLEQGMDGLFSATAEGVINLLRYYNIEMSGANAVVLGRSKLVGQPIATMLEAEGAKVTVCHSKTPDISLFTKKADILVSAVGKRGLVTSKIVKEGAVVVDVGLDVDFDSVSGVASYLTPGIGGVGPMTVAMLLSNVVKAAKMQEQA